MRRLLSIRGVNDVFLSRGFLNPVYLPPTHDVHKDRRTGEPESWYFPTQGRCHEVSIGFLFYGFTCPFVNHRREEVLVKPLAHPLQFPLSTQRDLGMGLIEKKKKRGKGIGRDEWGWSLLTITIHVNAHTHAHAHKHQAVFPNISTRATFSPQALGSSAKLFSQELQGCKRSRVLDMMTAKGMPAGRQLSNPGCEGPWDTGT